MWSGLPMVVLNMIVFHDDIGALALVFDRFPTSERVNSLLLF
jgi:hypothetical protein